jgi:hypothetical protein
MHGYTIVYMEADLVAVEDRVLEHFNEYIQSKDHAPAFVTENEGYFRIGYDGKKDAVSAAIEAFGNFLLSSGYSINGISTAKTSEGNEGTLVQFSHDGKDEKVVLSTLKVY